MNVAWECVRARLRAPFEAAWGSLAERELVLVRLEDAAGRVGFGEAAPLPGYGEASASVEQVVGALEAFRKMAADGDGAVHAELLKACAAVADVPQALAAIDLALWDLEGRRAGVPVWKLLGAGAAPTVALNATLVGDDVAAEAVRAREAGFTCVKLKVGLADDHERVAAVRAELGRAVAIRVDANGAWGFEEAIRVLGELETIGIELCEEPVHGLAAVAQVASSTSVPVALDESAALEGALDRRVCDAVCLKVARCGGISGLLSAARQARAAGYRVYLASTLDGPLGIAAALHAAAALRPELPCGLATLSLFERAHPLGALAGRASPPPGPGLGERLVEWYR